MRLISTTEYMQISLVRSSKFFSRFLSVLLIALVCSMALSAELAEAQKVATLEKVKGNVRVFKGGKKRGLKGRSGMALFANSVVKTVAKEAFADVVYSKGTVVRIMPHSELTLASVEMSKGKLQVKIDLAAGKIFNVVTKLAEGSVYEVKTKTATSGVKGTIFSAETTDTESVFMVKEGKVEAINLAGTRTPVLVTDLKKTIVQANQAPTEPIDLTPEEIAMFDILDDILEDIKADIRDEVQEEIKEGIIEDALP